jgi:protein-L-isoaspartate(D-aspartate) O-methyltransferase
MAHCVGSEGQVLAYEADAALARDAAANLADMPWVTMRAEAAAGALDGPYDAILVNAGVTHPLDAWLDALAPSGRMILPLTASMPAMGPIGKGFVFLITRNGEQWSARLAGFVAIYSAVGIREEWLNAALGKAMMAGPQRAQAIKRLRRDPHEPALECWLHGSGFCLSA